jgi:hypothetical protein
MTKVGTPLATVKRLALALAAGTVGLGVFAAPASAQPTGEPGEPTCRAAITSTSVQPWELGPGRRAVADTFFGDNGPKAVQVAERTLQAYCAGQ